MSGHGGPYRSGRHAALPAMGQWYRAGYRRAWLDCLLLGGITVDLMILWGRHGP